MGPKLIQHDNLDREPRSPVAPVGDHSWSRQQRRAFDWRGIGVIAAFLLIALLFVTLRYDRRFFEWVQYGGGSWIVYVLIGAAVLAYLKWWLLVEQPGGYRVMWLQISNRRIGAAVDAQMIAEGMIKAQQFEAQRMFAEARQLTLTTAPEMPMIDSGFVDGEVVPGEDATPALLLPDEWMPWFDARPHGLLAAETGGGKSTLFKLITKSRIERGELVFLLDPHSSDWFGLPAIGGGEDWEAIWCGMQVVIDEYKARLQARNLYLQQHGLEMPTDNFKRITVLLDEANTACRKFSVAKRGQETRWEQFAEALGSGARKVGISIQLLAQSPVVEDLEMTRPMLNNFTRICLDSYTVQLLISKSLDSKEQKQALARSVQGQQFPAAATIKGYAVLLDRTGLDRIAPPIRPERAIWTEGYARAEELIMEMRAKEQQPARQVVSAAAHADSAVSTSMPVPGAIVYPPNIKSKNARIAWLLKQEYKYRQIESELNVSHQTISQIKKAMGI